MEIKTLNFQYHFNVADPVSMPGGAFKVQSSSSGYWDATVY